MRSNTAPVFENQTCHHCGSPDFVTHERKFSNGTKHLELRCSAGHFQKFLPQNNPVFVMPFGRHKGKAIKDLPDDYLAWMLENADLKNNLRRHLEAEFERRGTT